MDNKHTVQSQFGPNAAAYAASRVHAQGASLARLLALTDPQPDWRVLDVATGAGHTAVTFAPHVAHVIAADITAAMLAQTRALAQTRPCPNLHTCAAAAGHFPFPDHTFDLITCRLAAHHFPDIGGFLADAARVLGPGGLLAVTDTVVPGTRLRGKKARRLREAGRYINAYEKLRDPSHHRCLSVHEWEDVARAAGFRLKAQELLPMPLDFDAWTERMRVTAVNRTRLRAMLVQAPQPVLDFLTPEFVGDRITFHFTELILIAEKIT